MKQFCIHGHDTFVTGRNQRKQCLGCKKDYTRNRKRWRKEQFCIKGHDKSIVGRNSEGKCLACIRDWRLSRCEPKQFCIHGHDTLVVGRDSRHSCKACKKTRPKNAIYKQKNAIYKHKLNETQRVRKMERMRKWRAINKNKIRESARNYRQANKVKIHISQMLRYLFGTGSKELPKELIDIGVLYYQLKKELRNGKAAEY